MRPQLIGGHFNSSMVAGFQIAFQLAFVYVLKGVLLMVNKFAAIRIPYIQWLKSRWWLFLGWRLPLKRQEKRQCLSSTPKTKVLPRAAILDIPSAIRVVGYTSALTVSVLWVKQLQLEIGAVDSCQQNKRRKRCAARDQQETSKFANSRVSPVFEVGAKHVMGVAAGGERAPAG